MKEAKLIDKTKHGVELRWSNGRSVWPGWNQRPSCFLKRGYWVGDERYHIYVGYWKEFAMLDWSWRKENE